MANYSRKILQQKELSWVANLAAQAQSRGFFGKMVLVFEDGHVRRIVKEESLLPPVLDSEGGPETVG